MYEYQQSNNNGNSNFTFYERNDSYNNINNASNDNRPETSTVIISQKRSSIDLFWQIFEIAFFTVLIIASSILLIFHFKDLINEKLDDYFAKETTKFTFKYTATVPSQQQCGKQDILPIINGTNRNRILNGEDAIPNSWPWMVSLRLAYSDYSLSTHFCGGVLIFPQYVLTAAHCLKGLKNHQLAVVVGSNGIDTFSWSDVYYASSYLANANYNSKNIVNDIGLIKLDEPVEYSSNVASICLPPSSKNLQDIFNKEVVLTGWGSTDGKGKTEDLASNLQQTVAQVINGDYRCEPYDYTASVYCTIDQNQKSNVCFGDSGGPLMYHSNGSWYVYGIASFITAYNDGDCDPTSPAYFTQVPQYLDWIGNAIANL